MRNITGPLVGFFITFAFCVLIVAVPMSCSGGTNCKDPANASSAACVIQTTALECAGGDVAGVVTQYTPAVEDIVRKGLNPDGSINYNAIEGDLVTAVLKYGWCVVSSVFDHYMNAAPVTPGTGSGSLAKATPPAPTPTAAKDAFAKLHAKVGATLKIHAPSGVMP